MKKEYDFSKSEPSPYWKRILKQGMEVQYDLQVSLKDLINAKEVIAENKELRKKVKNLENKVDSLAKDIKKWKKSKAAIPGK